MACSVRRLDGKAQGTSPRPAGICHNAGVCRVFLVSVARPREDHHARTGEVRRTTPHGAVRRTAPAAPGPCLPDARAPSRRPRRCSTSARERWSAGYPPKSRTPETALTTLVTRLAMDRMRLIRAARQGYSGSWLPEPVPCRSRDDEPMSLELLAAMERLSPLERAAYVLRVVLARPYPEVADVLGRRLPAVRQLVRRARVHLGDAATPDEADRTRHEVVVRRLAAACRSASLGALVDVLGPDVVLLSDEGRRGPGSSRARRRPRPRGTVDRRRPAATPP